MIVRWVTYGLASWLLLIGIWNHDWRLILAGVSTLTIWPLITTDVERQR